MTYPSIKETFYRTSSAERVVLTVPHGADSHDFLQFFPEIKADPELAKVWPLFETYLDIEKDFGATELAHSLGFELASFHGIDTRVVELNYPRGILDGGRLRDHCLRQCLPPQLMASLSAAMLRIHDASLSYMDRLYTEFAKTQGFLLDVHTMASYCPVDESGKAFTFPISFPRLEAYVNQYLNARNHNYRRKIDLICSDENGRKLADPRLLSSLARELTLRNYVCLENEPYHAAPIYLSYQHMSMVPSLSLDVPKHLVAEGDELDKLAIHPEGIRRLAEALARGVAGAFSLSA